MSVQSEFEVVKLTFIVISRDDIVLGCFGVEAAIVSDEMTMY
jgi:hypothetical protein